MRLAISGARTELGKVLSREALAAGHELPADGPVDALIAVGLQPPNSLLHDGHGWKDFPDTAVARAQRAVQRAQVREAKDVVFASYAFLRSPGLDQARWPLRAVADAAQGVEQLVLDAPVRGRVVRLGYLYGPSMKDLRAYRTAFRLGRPYWSGPRVARQDHVHQLDACAALLAAADSRSRERLHYATDGHPVPFVEFMDTFARMVGNPLPLHLGGVFRLTARLIIREEHMEAVKLKVPRAAPSPRVPGWQPAYPGYRDGLEQVMSAWSGSRRI